MYLYYTSINGKESQQLNPTLSLGGFKSSSRVDNNKFGNLFGDISNVTISNYNQNQYIALILKNETGANKTNINVWFGYPEKCYSKFLIAAVDMVADASGILQMEYVNNKESKPLFATFYEADGEANSVNIGNLDDGDQVGIWIERELLIDFIKQDQSNIWEDDPAQPGRVKEIVLGKSDDIKLNIKWD